MFKLCVSMVFLKKKEGEMAISHCFHSLAVSGEAIKQLIPGQILIALCISNLAIAVTPPAPL